MNCRLCKTNFKTRPLYLAHIAVCNFQEKDEEVESAEESDFYYDSDKDPAWEPEADDNSNDAVASQALSPLQEEWFNSHNEHTENNNEPASSPLTREQIETAEQAEAMLIEYIPKDNQREKVVQVTRSENTTNGTKTKNKKLYKTKQNWCKYCKSMQTKIGRHMAAKHKDIEEVQMYLKVKDVDKEKQKKERRRIIKPIINESNNSYNEMVISKEGLDMGKPIPVRRTVSREVLKTSHVVCTFCKGLFLRKYFFKHKSNCKSSCNSSKSSSQSPQSILFESPLEEKFLALQRKVLDKMVKDTIYTILRKDKLILEFGRRFLKCHMATHQRNYVGNKLRTLAVLLHRMNELEPTSIKDFKDCIDPLNFDLLCTVVRKWSKYDEDSGFCLTGSVPRRMCKSLKMCSQILWSEAIKCKSMTVEEQLAIRGSHDKFMSLMESDWSFEVNSVGDKSLQKSKMLKEDKMPLDEDIVKFFENMTIKLEKYNNELKKSGDLQNYDCLTKSVLAYLTAFNSRRPNEVAYSTVHNYSKLQISDVEHGQENLAVFTVAATKNDVKVPVIVPYVVQQAITTLLVFRSSLEIEGDLLLGKKNGTAYNGSELLTKFKSEMSLKHPSDFSANGLRHYWATRSQLDPEVKRHMPKFLGHTLSTHQRFYEMPLSHVHLNVIGPVLLKHTQKKQIQNCTNPSSNEVIQVPNNEESISTERDLIQTSNLESKKQCKRTPPKKQKSDNESSDDSFTSPLPIRKRNSWITPEKEELWTKLPHTVLGLQPAGKGKILEAWKNSKIIKTRHSLQMTRIEVSKYFTNKKTIPTPIKEKLLAKVNEGN